MNLFAAAEKKSTKNTKSKKAHTIVKPDNQEELFELISEYTKQDKIAKTTKTKLDAVKSELKEISKEEFVNLFKTSNKYPGTFVVEAEEADETATFMFSPTDKYIKIEKENADALIEEFGEGVVTKKSEFGFDSELLQKHGEAISNAIMALDIPDADKAKLITNKTSYSVSKGTIEDLHTLSSETNQELEMVLEKINPIFTMKTPKVVKSV